MVCCGTAAHPSARRRRRHGRRDHLPHRVPRIIAGVARIVRDVGIAEELAQDALVAALEQWPRDGVPDNPGAWLMATAKHRAIDLVRRRERYARKLEEVGRDLSLSAPHHLDEPADPDDIDDDLLRLVFTACHPVLSAEARIALTLRLLGGLTTPEIARAFLVPEATVAQRIVRAKRTLAAKGSPSRSRTAPNAKSGSGPYWRSSTSSSTRGTRPRRATTCSVRRCARTRSGWPGCSPS